MWYTLPYSYNHPSIQCHFHAQPNITQTHHPHNLCWNMIDEGSLMFSYFQNDFWKHFFIRSLSISSFLMVISIKGLYVTKLDELLTQFMNNIWYHMFIIISLLDIVKWVIIGFKFWVMLGHWFKWKWKVVRYNYHHIAYVN